MERDIQIWDDFLPYYQCGEGFTPGDYTCVGTDYVTTTPSNDAPVYMMTDPLALITVITFSVAIASAYMAYESHIKKGGPTGPLWLLLSGLSGTFGVNLLEIIITG